MDNIDFSEMTKAEKSNLENRVLSEKRENPQFLLPLKGRVVFIGDSITYAGGYSGFIEAYTISHYPDRQLEFINIGLPSETVSGLSEPSHMKHGFPRPDLHERLSRVLERTKPDVVFACYGMNDGIYMPFDEERFQKYKEGMIWLRAQVEKTGSKMIHVTPPIYDEVKGEQRDYNLVLNCYSNWLLEQRSAGWEVVDVHGPMDCNLALERKRNPDFAYADDGVHPGSAGHWVIAKQIL